MNAAELGRLAVEALYLALLLSGPALLAAAAIGIVVGLFQAMTQIHEPSLQFVPKLLGVAAVIGLAGAWMGGELLRFTTELWTHMLLTR